MNNEEIEKNFKAQLASVLRNLKDAGIKDKQAMLLIGSLAGNLINKAKVDNWTDLKASLSKKAFLGLIDEMQQQGLELQEKGNVKAAYAIQAIGVSLIANTMQDPDTKKGKEFLDTLINHAYLSTKQIKSNNNN